MEHPNTQALYAYWDELRGGRDAPVRSEIDPRRIAGSLETMFVLERLEGGQTRIRLAGTHLCELAGMELRGMMVETLMVPGQEDEAAELAARVLDTPGCGVMRLRATDAEGVEWVGEALFLPLYSEIGELARVIGCVNFLGTERRSKPVGPLRLRSLGARVSPLSEDLMQGAAAPRPAARIPAPVPAEGFAEAPAGFLRAPRGEAAPKLAGPNLTAIEGNPDAPRGDGDGRARPRLRIVED
ncbi:MAG: PAS domain-containing protein [Pseudomonadota bacterium]